MYFDPGFGSMIIQAIIAGIATLGVVWGIMKVRVKGLFVKKNHPEQDETLEDQDAQL